VRFWLLVPVFAALVAGVLLAASAFAGTASSPQPFVPQGAYLVALAGSDGNGHQLAVLNSRGRLLRNGPQIPDGYGMQAMALSADRQSAYVSVDDSSPRLYEIALASGKRVLIADDAMSPALSPDGTELAYLTVDSGVLTALAIRNLQTGSVRTIPFPPHVGVGTPPELVINWSPHGRFIALFDGTRTRIVNVASAPTVESQRTIRNMGPGVSPVFLGKHKLVVLVHCCSTQLLTAVDLRSDAEKYWAYVGNPPEDIHRLNPNTLLAVTAMHRFVLITQGHRAKAITKRKIVAVAP